jgi:ribosomal protein S18 acetylase RimI-like enzyme
MTSGFQIFGAPTFGSQVEVLDLRHFSALQLRPLLEDEARLWQERLHWNYTPSVELLLEYLDGRVLPGYVALHGGRAVGYAFAVFEGVKAVIGDVYAFGETNSLKNPVCDTLLHHLIEMLQATPGVDRIEAQLLMFPEGALVSPFAARGFRSYPRLFMMWDFATAPPATLAALPQGLRLATWHEDLYDAGAELVYRAYAGHMDSSINDQYRTVHGSARFLHNIVRFPGCGVFDAANSWVLLDRSNKMHGMVLSSRVREDVGHITQLCVTPAMRGNGLGRVLLTQCARTLIASGANAMSLTVTESNVVARKLYDELGFETRHRFEARVWDSGE